MNRKTVLVVEDNPITRKMIRVGLESAKYRVIEAGDADSALHALETEAPDLVLQDLGLPDMDGMELLRRLRETPGGDGIPILAVSGYVARMELACQLNAGFDDYLFKPIAPSRLLEVVEAHLGSGASAAEEDRGLRVLLAHDDPFLLKIVRLRLESLGFRVDTARDGQEALELALKSPPDAVVSDVLMPRMDGFRLCQAIRNSPELASLPVILFSASYTEPDDRALAERVGADDLVVCSPDGEEILAALRGGIRRPARRPSVGDAELPIEEYSHRIIRQLERQTLKSADLARRLSFLEAETGIIGSLQASLRRADRIETVLDEILQRCLDGAGASMGLVYLLDPAGELRLTSQFGYDLRGNADLDRFFGCSEVLRRSIESDTPAVVPGVAIGEEWCSRLLAASDCRSMLLIPLSFAGERLGILAVGSRIRDTAEGEWVGFASAVGRQIGQAVELTRTLSMLRDAEARYRSLVHGMEAIVWEADPETYGINFVNAWAERLLGYPTARWTAADFLAEIVHEEDRDALLRARAELIAEGSQHAVEFRVRAADGRVVWLRKTAQVARDGAGRPTQFRGLMVDITPSRLALEERDRLVAILDATTDVVGMADDSGCVVYLNRTARGALGLTPSADLDAAGLSLYDTDLIAGSMVAGSLETAIRDGVWRGETTLVGRDGLKVPMSQVLLSHPDREGRVRYTSTIMRDISEQKAAHDRLLATLRELEQTQAKIVEQERLRAMGQMASGIAHDFNNVLVPILGYSELLALDPEIVDDRDRVLMYIDRIRTAAGDAAAIVSRLREFYRQREEHETPDSLDLNDIVRAAIEITQPLWKDQALVRGVSIQVRHEASEIPAIQGSASDLREVLTNLIINAADAMDSEGPIDVRTAYGAGRVLLEVVDTGSGMSEATRQRCFEPFYTTKGERGTGLGLAMVRGIVRRLGGEIEVRSAPGEGTAFQLSFPAAGDVVDADKTVPSAGAMRPLRILAVEDDASAGQFLVDLLEHDGHSVALAADGSAGEARFEAGAFDLVITDFAMPGQTGERLAARLKQVEPGVPIIMVTGFGDIFESSDALPTSIEPLLKKPINPTALRAAIADLAGRAAEPRADDEETRDVSGPA